MVPNRNYQVENTKEKKIEPPKDLLIISASQNKRTGQKYSACHPIYKNQEKKKKKEGEILVGS